MDYNNRFYYRSFFTGMIIGFISMGIYLFKNSENLPPRAKKVKTKLTGIDDEPFHSSETHTGG